MKFAGILVRFRSAVRIPARRGRSSLLHPPGGRDMKQTAKLTNTDAITPEAFSKPQAMIAVLVATLLLLYADTGNAVTILTLTGDESQTTPDLVYSEAQALAGT